MVKFEKINQLHMVYKIMGSADTITQSVDDWIRDYPNAKVEKVEVFGNKLEGWQYLVWYS